ncbi:platelet endothelial aggregation receptor 1 isoform X2 [Halyomorpha halys]|uniref:platelet endothelial aggregation receptor 1 isoform X2 n=1 Tax=Halyomorpha halys TaxID=286706 RepID=UPI0006D4CE47|nr:platelet endothelial aggregation receptor 1-like isoform X2 [Halyomorpha halys]
MMPLHYESLCILLLIFKIGFLRAYLIGERCKYDDDCFVDNSYCEMQQICECKENFLPSDDGETCIAMIGAHCHSKYDCTTLPNSICKEDRCICDRGYVSDSQQTKCMPTQNIKDKCEHDFQCKDRLGDQSHCLNGQCVCYPGYHFENWCISSKRLHEGCRNDSQCYIGDNYQHSVLCLSGYCKCAPGYHEDINLCIVNGGSSDLPTRLGLLMIFSTSVNSILQKVVIY